LSSCARSVWKGIPIMSRRLNPKELDAYGEISLALAQASMQQAIDSSGLDRDTVAMRVCDSSGKRWSNAHLKKLLAGNCDLTIKDMGRLFAICGFEVRFSRIPRLKLDRDSSKVCPCCNRPRLPRWECIECHHRWGSRKGITCPECGTDAEHKKLLPWGKY
jgi:hypothetical protein